MTTYYEARVTQQLCQVLSLSSPPAARVTQLTVQTLSDAFSTGEVRVTQLVVQTLSDTGEAVVTPDATDPDTAVGEMMSLVAEITMAVDASGATRTLLVTDGPPFATLATDTPASTVVHDRLQKPATMERTMFSSGTTFGAVSSGYGLCEIANSDGLLDAWANYAVAGQSFVLRAGRPGTAYPSAWTTLLRATMQAVEADTDAIRVRLRDRVEYLSRALVRTTTDPDPQLYGKAFNVTPVLVDPVNLVYAAGRPPTGKLVVIQSVRDEGLSLVHESGGAGDYATAVATEVGVAAAYVSAGRWNWHAGSGRFKVGSKPAGALTATVVVIDDDAEWTATDDPGANVKVGTMLAQMAQATGIGLGDIVTSDVNNVDIACGATPFGYWSDGSQTTLEAMNALANSLGVWFGFDRLDQFRMGQFSVPAGDSSWSFTEHNIARGSVKRVTSNDPGRGVPVWRVVARSNHNDAQSSAFAGAVSEADKALMGPEWPVETVVEDDTVLAWCPAATELAIEVRSSAAAPSTTSDAAATTDAGEAQRRLDLYSGSAEMVQLEVAATPLLLTSIDIGSVVTLKFNRYGWDAGEQFVVVGIRTQ